MFSRIVLPALALACAVPAVAQPVIMTVVYGDLDLTTADGRAVLDARLDRAARKICGGMLEARNLQMMQARRSCLAEARTSYRAQVDLALNTANSRRVAVLADKLGMLAGF